MDARELLVAALREQQPLVLVLGQDAWRENGQEDPVLAKALAHLGREDAKQRGWRALLAEPLPSGFYEWLTERLERRVPPDSLSALGEVPWSAVFSSSLDPTLKDLFGKRQHPELVLTSAEMPPAVRSRVRPPIYHLFGHAAASLDPRAQPPADRAALNGRRVNDTMPLLNRILDTATPRGVVAVDGVAATRDWLRIDDLMGAVSNAGDHRIIWFMGRDSALPDDDDFAAAVDAGRILVAKERLSTAIAHIRAVPQVADILVPTPEEAGTITFNEKKALEVSPEQRLHVEAVASIVDDAWNAPLAELGRDAAYAAFRQFHGYHGNRRSLVEGVRRGFAIKRDYEDVLLSRVVDAINDHASVNAPIILHGQSATGKSIALARVVAEVRDARDAAVLYSTNRVPQPAEIADFCRRAERSGAKATLIVCDTNQDDRPYVDLLSGLRSRGHRVVVLGSRYRIIDGREDRPKKTTIEAPNVLSPREELYLSALLERFADELVAPKTFRDHHVLSFLYRALPLARFRIGSGLSTEATQTERVVREQRAGYGVSSPPRTTMAQRLIEAGADNVFPSLFDGRQRQAIDSDDGAGRIIDLVMAAGSLGCSVPSNLLWRLTANHPSTSLSPAATFEVFGSLDLFRWDWADDEQNELLIGPRLTLEAELICARRLGSPEKEAECVVELISAIRSVGTDLDHERRFLLNLLRRIGPYGPRQKQYRAAYVRIGEALTELRTRFGVFDPSVVLQESVFRRHAVREGAVEEGTRRMTLLTEARDAIQAALDGIATDAVRASRWTQRSLKGELASLYGFIARLKAETARPNDEIWSSYLAARSARRAASASDSYHPMDIGLWTPSDLLQKGEMTNWQRAELTADIYDILDQVDLDALQPEQRERFDVRRFRTADALNDQKLSDSAFADLIERDSAAGCYLRARKLAPDWDDHQETFSVAEREQARCAAEFLEQYMSLVSQDARSLSLLLECRWIWEVGRRPFVGQRQPLPAGAAARNVLLHIVAKLNEASGENPRNVTRYLAATLTWLSGGEKVATEMFRELARDTDYEDAGRVVQRHVIAGQGGRTKSFNGRVEGEPRGGSCTVRLESGNRQVVQLLERDFRRYEIAYGRQIRGFGVAFNYIGPIATPIP